jgi:Protein of unknown function (DUF1579)
MTVSRSAVVILANFLCASGLLAQVKIDDAAQKRHDQVVAEMRAVLGRLAGEWDTTVTLAPAAWTPKEQQLKGVTTAKAILKGKAVQLTGEWLPGGGEFTLTLGYDDWSHKFEGIYLDSGPGMGSIHGGRWDADKKTLALDCRSLSPTSLNRCEIHFTGEDTCEVVVELADRTFAKHLDLKAELTRRK